MTKNYMADVAKMLGVELGEWFKTSKNAKICEELTYKFTARGLYVEFIDNEGTAWFDAADGKAWVGILNGEYEIVKLPWKPKFGGIYYHPTICDPYICDKRWYGTTFDCAMCALGMCYRTCEEAKEHFAEDYKKLTGEELRE